MKSTKWLNSLFRSNSCLMLIGLVVCLSVRVNGQSIGLDRFYQALEQHYPLVKNTELLQQQSKENDIKLMKGYLPQLQAYGQATYQSEVTAIGNYVQLPIPGNPGFPVPAKDQYRATLSIQQNLYDGGMIAAQRKANQLSGLTELQQNKVNLYQVKEQVGHLFFQVLLLDENSRINESVLTELQTRLKTKQGALKYGAAQASEVDALEAEVLKVLQSIQGLADDRITLIRNLNILTGLNEPSNTSLLAPTDILDTTVLTENRPEYELFAVQKQALDAQYQITKNSVLPKLSLFGDGNYGRPGYDFLRSNFGPSWLIGAKIIFNISGFYTQKQEKTLTTLKAQQVDVQKNIFRLDQSQQYDRQLNEIQKLNRQLAADEKIIELRTKVKKATAAKLDNGVATVTDYVTDLQAEQQAILTRALHCIQKLQAAEELKLINGSK